MNIEAFRATDGGERPGFARPNHVELARQVSFGRFHLLPHQKLLLDGDRPVRLGSRAVEILVFLVANAGRVVGRAELMAQVWPHTFVEDVNLSVHMAALRKALGDRKGEQHHVLTVPGRGYQFVAPLTTNDEAALAVVDPRHDGPVARVLPAPLVNVIGRDEIIGAIVAQASSSRLVTIVGHGGIGKTAVALAAASRLTASRALEACFVDLASEVDPSRLQGAVIAALAAAPAPGQGRQPWAAILGDQRLLMILDGCEGAIGPVAGLVEDILQNAPGVTIIATSREALRAQGEHVFRLAPLPVPQARHGLTAAEALAFPAVRLFVERAAACVHGYRLTDANAPLVVDICRRLDGIALAIELAAGRIDVFGTKGVAERIADDYRWLAQGRRTSLPRHQSMSASLDWSHQLLTATERTVLDHLAAFTGPFTLHALSERPAGLPADVTVHELIDGIAGLVAKSVLLVDFAGSTPQYRLLDTTRQYVLQKRSYGDAAARPVKLAALPPPVRGC